VTLCLVWQAKVTALPLLHALATHHDVAGDARAH
jgi:hypothetical protein